MPTNSLYKKKHARSISSFNPVGVNDFNSKIWPVTPDKAVFVSAVLLCVQCYRGNHSKSGT